MRLHVLSDLHLEFEPLELPDTGADVVVLAGDIDKGVRGIEMAQRRFADRPVLYLAGNHEYYGHALPALTEKLRQACVGTKVFFLENTELVLDGVRFLGCTLWTDFALFGPENLDRAMEQAQHVMNDYEKIRRSPEYRRLAPRDTLIRHQVSRRFLEERLAAPHPGPTVVVTHHAPSLQSCQERFLRHLLTTAFISDLEPLMGGDRVDLWIHGHTHHCVDYQVRGTRVVSNQRGYPGEGVPGFRPDFVVEVG